MLRKTLTKSYIHYKSLKRLGILGAYLNIIKAIFNLQQTYELYQIIWKEAQNNSIEIRKKLRLPTCSICIQYSTWHCNWSNKKTKGDQVVKNWQERSQSIIIGWQYDSIIKISEKFHQGTPTTGKHL